jgi:hypothetical protein
VNNRDAVAGKPRNGSKSRCRATAKTVGSKSVNRESAGLEEATRE